MSMETERWSRFKPKSNKARFLSLGSTGLAFQLSEHIVVKKVRPGREADLDRERSIFRLLGRHPPSPYIVQAFYQTDDAIFLECAQKGDLASLLRQFQERDESGRRVVQVTRRPPWADCLRWIKQLGAAAAWLETLGLAHCDIRPGNMLLFASGDTKLADFDRALRVGDPLLSGTEPFARLLGREGGTDAGTYGRAGARSEQFAVGSVLYSLARGHDPFEDEWWGYDHGPIRRDKLQRMEFPAVGDLACAEVIRGCWHGRHRSMADLSAALARLDEEPWEVTCEADPTWKEARARECEAVAASGLLGELSWI
ncbi:hypothetical protein VTK73DRAFT_1828 [Phialemonium thermophilum]|uniref:Protein kinase domain-containing protein n=1 Tax=Phialemonium thermophilum TaxID=223376 RepID=A0ABR3VSW3_9PEZI